MSNCNHLACQQGSLCQFEGRTADTVISRSVRLSEVKSQLAEAKAEIEKLKQESIDKGTEIFFYEKANSAYQAENAALKERNALLEKVLEAAKN